MRVSSATPWPIDFDKLSRGSVITAETIASIRGDEPGTDRYNLTRLALANDIRRHFERFRGDTVSVTNAGDGLRVLTHQEQDQYVQDGKRRAARMFLNRHAEDCGNDPGQLTDEQRARRDQRLLLDGWKAQQLRKRRPPELKE